MFKVQTLKLAEGQLFPEDRLKFVSGRRRCHGHRGMMFPLDGCLSLPFDGNSHENPTM